MKKDIKKVANKETNNYKKLTDKEIVKWTKILGCDEFIRLYIDDKITLTSKQLDKVINLKNKAAVNKNRMKDNGKDQ